MSSAAIVQKLWNDCDVLRDDRMSYGDYVEQLTYLLFLKMADERTKPPTAIRYDGLVSLVVGSDTNQVISPSEVSKGGN
jgi:hypothetical protein